MTLQEFKDHWFVIVFGILFFVFWSAMSIRLMRKTRSKDDDGYIK